LWLFSLPFLLPLLVWGVQRWQNAKVSNYYVGGFKSNVVGERAAVKKLTMLLSEARDKGTIRIMWSVSKPAKKLTKTRSIETWLYGFFYDRRAERLMHYTLSPSVSDPDQAELTQYGQVTAMTIRSTANSGGTLGALTSHGAKLIRRGEGFFDPKRGLAFR
jgi:hypothetical protein